MVGGARATRGRHPAPEPKSARGTRVSLLRHVFLKFPRAESARADM
ncbi:hypothetical protein FTUN_0672 [Frigoriglobus tundricola]|uniref:Uncharacterized protein n=1 Tax=Frigoriglobus tundricola TaxID=2774151 RepID=A0A6M5YGL5_9BACT|nr:hypothetical protein FTUN_0672 [Frigoriglobus tundricola]